MAFGFGAGKFRRTAGNMMGALNRLREGGGARGWFARFKNREGKPEEPPHPGQTRPMNRGVGMFRKLIRKPDEAPTTTPTEKKKEGQVEE